MSDRVIGITNCGQRRSFNVHLSERSGHFCQIGETVTGVTQRCIANYARVVGGHLKLNLEELTEAMPIHLNNNKLSRGQITATNCRGTQEKEGLPSHGRRDSL